jgi:hypothetical protein
MRIPVAETALEPIASWGVRGRWKEERRRVLNEHLAPVCVHHNSTPPTFAHLVPPAVASAVQQTRTVTACAVRGNLSAKIPLPSSHHHPQAARSRN